MPLKRVSTGTTILSGRVGMPVGKVKVLRVRCLQSYEVGEGSVVGRVYSSFFGWEAGTRTPIARSRVWSPTIGRPPSKRSLKFTDHSRSCQREVELWALSCVL